jgi:sporulation protein YqfC
MIENLINYIKDDDYLIGIYSGMIHIFNYKRVVDIMPNEISIQLKNNKIIVYGENLIIKKLDKLEMLINGKIKRVDFVE